MKTTIDSAGRIVIPKAIRDDLGLRGGEELDVSERDGRIEIEPIPVEMHVEERDGLHVIVPEVPLPVLTDEIVRDTLEKVRRRE